MNENQKKEIATTAILYLKNRMMINQKLISMGDNQMDFESFMSLYNKYLEIKDYVEEHPNEMINSDKNQISFVEKIEQLRRDLIRLNADSIVMTEEQIDELMLYIKESIEKYGLNSTHFYNENDFVRKVLSQFVEKLSETKDKATNDKIKRAKKFLTFARINENAGFCQTIEGHISYDNDKFFISTHNLKPVCKINREGINESTDNELDNEDILISDKMYIGSLTSNENMFCIFLEKTINGQRKMKAISYNQEVYDISGEKNQANNIITFERAIIYDKMNDFFKKNNLSFLTSNIYTKESFCETITAFNKFNNMLPEERNEIETVVETATSWWIDNLSLNSLTPFGSGIEDEIVVSLRNINKEMEETFDIYRNITKDRKNEITKFKEVLGNRLRIILLSRYSYYLKTDYRPEGELALAIKQSKLRGTFPVKTHMNISRDKIEVRKGDSSPLEVIYSKCEDTKFRK